jgi:hypothetical protein
MSKGKNINMCLLIAIYSITNRSRYQSSHVAINIIILLSLHNETDLVYFLFFIFSFFSRENETLCKLLIISSQI